jgi:hypothetical protein
MKKEIEIKDLKTGDVFIGQDYYNNYYLKVVDKLGITYSGLINVVYKFMSDVVCVCKGNEFNEKNYKVFKISI